MVMSTHVLRGWDDDVQRPTEYDVTAELLASASTHRDDHVRLVHDSGEHAPQGTRCSACRWFEVFIYRERGGTWVVQTVGRSLVPGEDDRYRVHFCPTPRRVIAALVQTRGEDVFVPNTAKRALDQAADADPVLAEAVDQLLEDGLAS